MNNSFNQVGIARLRRDSHTRTNYTKKTSNLEFAMRNSAWDELSRPRPQHGQFLAIAVIDA